MAGIGYGNVDGGNIEDINVQGNLLIPLLDLERLADGVVEVCQ